ncbi:MAG: PD40 domain-containing protein, partial [Pyrinomonadaceae bacterium]|nr:PD40 domain-containing protein [Pyrinomonadaceae bacterium]
MFSEPPQNSCPYKGLQPYTEADRAYFFGRERDQEIVASNLYAASLTILYGASGVGKSSVLLAGVVPQLRREPRLAVVVFRQWQDAGFATMLKSETLRAVAEKTGKAVDVDLSLPLDEFLLQCGKHLRGPIFLIFDQFEEFCLYHPPTQSDEGFDAEFARAINRQEVDANFLLSMREDGLSKLDRFRGRIPRLLGNMLRLEHLGMEAGREAVLKPLASYNRDLKEGQPQVSIEDGLVESLLDQVKTGKVTITQPVQGQASNAHLPDHSGEDARIETPFLQMVLTRLWNEELAAGSHTLRLETLHRLGGAQSIVRTHLDMVMDKLAESDRNVAAPLFRYLVTPSGMKIAHMPADLASYAELPDEDVSRVLMLLSSPEVRILRSVAPPPDQPDNLRYEIFHDVLGASILDWRRRYTDEQTQKAVRLQESERYKREQEEATRERERREARRLRKIVAILSLLLIVTIASTIIAFYQRKISRSSKIAANAYSKLSSDPELSLLLAVEAVETKNTTEATEALKAALLQAHTEFILPHKGGVYDAVFNADGTLIATAAILDNVKVWNAKTGELVKELQPQEKAEYKKGARNVAFSPDGKYLVASNWEGGTSRVWDTSTWQPIALLKVEPWINEKNEKIEEKKITNYSAAFSPDSSYLIITSDHVSPQVWRVGQWKRKE